MAKEDVLKEKSFDILRETEINFTGETALDNGLTEEEIYQADKVLSPTDALYGFVGWLTCRNEAVTFSGKHNAAVAAELVDEFVQKNEMPGVSPAYPENLRMPDEPAPDEFPEGEEEKK